MVAITRASTLILALAATYTNAGPSGSYKEEKFDKVVKADGSDEPVSSYDKDPYKLSYSSKSLKEPKYNDRNLQ
ncbi:hypothetical protein ACJ41O_000982 [Fusarium nematophilum]